MDPMLESFITESRENLELAGQCFLALEKQPDDSALLNDLFRSIHTMKGSSGLFDLLPLTRVVHAAEDVLDVVREGGLVLNPDSIDLFLNSMDLIGHWLDILEETEGLLPEGAETTGQHLAKDLQALLGALPGTTAPTDENISQSQESASPSDTTQAEARDLKIPEWVSKVPDSARQRLFQNMGQDDDLLAIAYQPEAQCFFTGDDPLFTVRKLPGLQWVDITARQDWPKSDEIDPFHCNLDFVALAAVGEDAAREHFRYVAEQVQIQTLAPGQLVFPSGEFAPTEPYELFVEDATKALETADFTHLRKLLEPLLGIAGNEVFQSSALAWIAILLQQPTQDSGLLKALIRAIDVGEFYLLEGQTTDPSADDASLENPANTPLSGFSDAANTLLSTQASILALPCEPDALEGRIASTSTVLGNVLSQQASGSPLDDLASARQACLEQVSLAPLQAFMQQLSGLADPSEPPVAESTAAESSATDATESAAISSTDQPKDDQGDRRQGDRRQKDRRLTAAADDVVTKKPASKTLRVDQQRIDTLMDLVGELVVAKNAIPFLARRAEEDFAVRALAKEIKAQYAVINRLSEELQSAMMAIRMVPVGTVFQRFPRLVRDLSRKLNKNIRLVMEGEETEADKNVVEDLPDPLIHIVRNSIDHGIESPAERVAAGKPEQGTLILRAIPMDDQVVIEIIDDGKGIDPAVIKHKAYEKSLIDEQRLDSISDEEAINLIFAAGFTTKEQATDLSGRGVGMDVVRTGIAKAGGTVVMHSEAGKGTRLRISLPLSMAVTQVMMVEVDSQCYGVPMDLIRETVRVPATALQRIKHSEAIVLRNKLIPLLRTRELLGLAAVTQPPAQEAILVVSIGGEEVGLIIDEFHEGIDIIQKPLPGLMGAYKIYAGGALLGDGRVLLILNLRELILCRSR